MRLASSYLLVVSLLFFLWRFPRARQAVGFSRLALWRAVSGSTSWARLPGLLLSAGLLLFLLALARPQWGQVVESERIMARDIILVLDLSYSMDFPLLGTRDVKKLDLAKQAAVEFLSRRKKDRVALMVFGDEAYGVWPLTTDMEILSRAVSRLGGRYYGGTNLVKPLREALGHFDEMGRSREKVLILLSDGDAPIAEGDRVWISQRMREQGIHFYLLGVQLSNAQDILSVVHSVQGRYLDIQKPEEFSRAFAEIARLEPSRIAVSRRLKYREIYPTMVLAGLGFFSLFLVLENTITLRVP